MASTIQRQQYNNHRRHGTSASLDAGGPISIPLPIPNQSLSPGLGIKMEHESLEEIDVKVMPHMDNHYDASLHCPTGTNMLMGNGDTPESTVSDGEEDDDTRREIKIEEQANAHLQHLLYSPLDSSDSDVSNYESPVCLPLQTEASTKIERASSSMPSEMTDTKQGFTAMYKLNVEMNVKKFCMYVRNLLPPTKTQIITTHTANIFVNEPQYRVVPHSPLRYTMFIHDGRFYAMWKQSDSNRQRVSKHPVTLLPGKCTVETVRGLQDVCKDGILQCTSPSGHLVDVCYINNTLCIVDCFMYNYCILSEATWNERLSMLKHITFNPTRNICVYPTSDEDTVSSSTLLSLLPQDRVFMRNCMSTLKNTTDMLFQPIRLDSQRSVIVGMATVSKHMQFRFPIEPYASWDECRNPSKINVLLTASGAEASRVYSSLQTDTDKLKYINSLKQYLYEARTGSMLKSKTDSLMMPSSQTHTAPSVPMNNVKSFRVHLDVPQAVYLIANVEYTEAASPTSTVADSVPYLVIHGIAWKTEQLDSQISDTEGSILTAPESRLAECMKWLSHQYASQCTNVQYFDRVYPIEYRLTCRSEQYCKPMEHDIPVFTIDTILSPIRWIDIGNSERIQDQMRVLVTTFLKYHSLKTQYPEMNIRNAYNTFVNTLMLNRTHVENAPSLLRQVQQLNPMTFSM